MKIHFPWVTVYGDPGDRAKWRCFVAMLCHEAMELLPFVDAHGNRWAARYAIGAPASYPTPGDQGSHFVISVDDSWPSVVDGGTLTILDGTSWQNRGSSGTVLRTLRGNSYNNAWEDVSPSDTGVYTFEGVWSSDTYNKGEAVIYSGHLHVRKNQSRRTDAPFDSDTSSWETKVDTERPVILWGGVDPRTIGYVAGTGFGTAANGTYYHDYTSPDGGDYINTGSTDAPVWESAAVLASGDYDPSADAGVAHSPGDLFNQWNGGGFINVWVGGAGGDNDWTVASVTYGTGAPVDHVAGDPIPAKVGSIYLWPDGEKVFFFNGSWVTVSFDENVLPFWINADPTGWTSVTQGSGQVNIVSGNFKVAIQTTNSGSRYHMDLTVGLTFGNNGETDTAGEEGQPIVVNFNSLFTSAFGGSWLMGYGPKATWQGAVAGVNVVGLLWNPTDPTVLSLAASDMLGQPFTSALTNGDCIYFNYSGLLEVND